MGRGDGHGGFGEQRLDLIQQYQLSADIFSTFLHSVRKGYGLLRCSCVGAVLAASGCTPSVFRTQRAGFYLPLATTRTTRTITFGMDSMCATHCEPRPPSHWPLCVAAGSSKATSSMQLVSQGSVAASHRYRMVTLSNVRKHLQRLEVRSIESEQCPMHPPHAHPAHPVGHGASALLSSVLLPGLRNDRWGAVS
jgi:hypothetical protein